jgi:hypothetical protein
MQVVANKTNNPKSRVNAFRPFEVTFGWRDLNREQRLTIRLNTFHKTKKFHSP